MSVPPWLVFKAIFDFSLTKYGKSTIPAELFRRHFAEVTSEYPDDTHIFKSRGSSGSIVSDYGLDDWVIEVRSPTGAEDFSSSPCVQTGSEAHPASYPMGTGVLSRGVKLGWGVTLTTHPI
jgi:hypothetical protein